MSITDELRKFIEKRVWKDDYRRDNLLAITDRIDAEHQKALDEQYKSLTVDMKPMTDENMAADGWIRLPKDADGEYIRIGDEMEGVDKYDSLKKVMGKVITVSFESDGIVDVAIQAWNSDGKSWHRAYLDQNASVYRHYHAPTIEDVLRELVGKAQALSRIDDEDKLVTEYAKRLTLAGDAE